MIKNELITSLRAALERDPDVNLHRYPIQITFDGTLRLSGEVEHIAAKRKIIQAARRLANSGRIEDHLDVMVGERRTDDALRQGVLRALTEEPAFHGLMIGGPDMEPPNEGDWMVASAEGTTVHLEGKVNSLSHRRLAEVLAWWVPGTSRVENRMRVYPPEEDNDDEISDAVRIVLEKDPSLDGEQISARTRERTVTLEGTVRTSENRRLAWYDCWYVPGVHAVENHLRVRSA